MNRIENVAAKPWYREPWPWLLMAGPAIVVVAGFITLALAIESSDGLVADDHYKQGKAINMTLHRDARAQALHYQAQGSITQAGAIALTFVSAAPVAPQLRLTLHHPTRSGFDREILLGRNADGNYAGAMPAIDAARWGMTLDDSSRSWRLTGDWPAGNTRFELGSTNR